MKLEVHVAPVALAITAAAVLSVPGLGRAAPSGADVPAVAPRGARAPGAAPVRADTTPPGVIPFTVDTLPNGLQLILSEDHSTPIVAVDLWYHVGARNETEGRYGFAHLFEHMMFQGSAHVGKTEHMTRIEAVGGSVNGSTTEDRTNYYEVVPADRVNLALWLEADRMRSLAVTQENLENQQKTVSEELRQRIANQPYSLAVLTAFYTESYRDMGCPGYAHSPAGTIHDVEAATLADVKDFHSRFYVPNNATLTVVGDIDPDQVRGLVRDYFGGIERGPSKEAVTCSVSFSPGMRVDTMVDTKANVPAVIWTYRVPPDSSPDHYPLQLLATLFGQGRSSRLFGSLVNSGAALQASASLDSRVGPGLLSGFILANQGVSPDSLLGLFRAQVERLHTNPPTEAELRKARNSVEADLIEGRQRVLSKAEALQSYAYFRPHVSEVNSDLRRYEAVTLDDLKGVIDRYLNQDNLTVIIDLPQGAVSGPGAGQGGPPASDTSGGGGGSGGRAASGKGGVR